MNIFKKRRRKDFKEAAISGNIKNLMAKAAGLIKSSERGDLESPEYDLDEIKAATESDSYIRISYLKHSYLLFKAGYMFKSNNENARKYIKTRLNLMSYSTNKPINILLNEIGDDMVRYSNAFLIKSRVPSVMQGINAKPIFGAKGVIGGYYRVDPNTMKVDRDKFGTVKKWTQSVDGEEKSYKPEEVIHLYMDKDAANAFGTPRIIAALEDVKLLRNLEGNIATMIYRFAMPLFHWIIGLPQSGFQATNKEIDEAEEVIDKLSIDGSVVTNEKTQIKVVGAEGSAISAEGYLKYFEQRALAALSISESQLGRGTAKQDADSMEAQTHDIIKRIQKTISIFVEHSIISELLLEGGFDPITNEEDAVEMIFNEISLETKIKLENHEVYKFQSNISTQDESRRSIGMTDPVDEKGLYDNLIKVNAEKGIAKARADETIRIAKENAKLAPTQPAGDIQSGKKGVNPKGNGNTGNNGPDKGAENIQNPKNQHGKTSVKIKEKALNKKAHKKKFDDIYKKYSIARNDIIRDSGKYKELSKEAIDAILKDILHEVSKSFLEGATRSSVDVKKIKKGFCTSLVANVKYDMYDMYESEIRGSLERVFDDIESKISKGVSVQDSFDTLEYRLRFLIEHVVSKANWMGYAKYAASAGFKKAYIHFGDSKDKEKHDSIVDLANIDSSKLPPFHPFCDCKVDLRRKE